MAIAFRQDSAKQQEQPQITRDKQAFLQALAPVVFESYTYEQLNTMIKRLEEVHTQKRSEWSLFRLNVAKYERKRRYFSQVYDIQI